MRTHHLNTFLIDFGFCSFKSFYESLVTPSYGLLFITLSGITSIGEFFFGISNFSLILLLLLINIELITGLWASYKRKKKIVSKKLQRFLLKMMVYFTFIMVFHVLSKEVDDFTTYIYKYMHSFTILYFVFVHIKSISENYSRITGKPSELRGFLDKLNKKFFNSQQE